MFLLNLRVHFNNLPQIVRAITPGEVRVVVKSAPLSREKFVVEKLEADSEVPGPHIDVTRLTSLGFLSCWYTEEETVIYPPNKRGNIEIMHFVNDDFAVYIEVDDNGNIVSTNFLYGRDATCHHQDGRKETVDQKFTALPGQLDESRLYILEQINSALLNFIMAYERLQAEVA